MMNLYFSSAWAVITIIINFFFHFTANTPAPETISQLLIVFAVYTAVFYFALKVGKIVNAN